MDGSYWDRFWPKVDASGDCWEWTASRQVLGYGRFATKGGRWESAHRVAWELLVGPIPEGMEVDHLCFNPPCVNPDHLEVVSRDENQKRRRWPVHRANEVKTHCPRGHEYTEANTIHSRPTAEGRKPRRSCRTCHYDRAKEKRRSAAQSVATEAIAS